VLLAERPDPKTAGHSARPGSERALTRRRRVAQAAVLVAERATGGEDVFLVVEAARDVVERHVDRARDPQQQGEPGIDPAGFEPLQLLLGEPASGGRDYGARAARIRGTW
jgi:hypothetical protein